MLKIVAKLVCPEDKFVFPSEEDKILFESTIPLIYREIPGYKAWDYLYSNGWFHFESDYEPDGDSKPPYLVFLKPQDDIENLELHLKCFDWAYEYSDDNRIYWKGEAEIKQIRKLMKIVGEPVASELYKRYCPFTKET